MGIKIVKTGSYKLGINEVQGLKKAMIKQMSVVQEHLKENCYWSDVQLIDSEYLGRSGFIPHTHNCGGIEICEVIPKCCEYDFSFLEFGEHDADCAIINGNSECNCGEADGLLDASLRVWFKFEGLDAAGNLKFYLYAGGGNNDAPYFRTEYSADIFEAEFTCRSVGALPETAKKHFKALLKKLS